jgi:hypothetical protein
MAQSGGACKAPAAPGDRETRRLRRPRRRPGDDATQECLGPQEAVRRRVRLTHPTCLRIAPFRGWRAQADACMGTRRPCGRHVRLPLTPTLSSWRSHAPHGCADGGRGDVGEARGEGELARRLHGVTSVGRAAISAAVLGPVEKRTGGTVVADVVRQAHHGVGAPCLRTMLGMSARCWQRLSFTLIGLVPAPCAYGIVRFASGHGAGAERGRPFQPAIRGSQFGQPAGRSHGPWSVSRDPECGGGASEAQLSAKVQGV